MSGQNKSAPGAYPVSFKISRKWKIVFFLLVIPLLALCVCTPFLEYKKDGLVVNVILGVMSLVMIVVLVWGLVDIMKSQVILYENKVVKRGIRGTRVLHINEILGYRHIARQYEVHLIPKDPSKKKIKISTFSERFSDILFWLATNFNDLDLQEQEAETKEILTDKSFGLTAHGRSERLNTAKRFASFFELGALLIALWGFFYPHPYEIIILALTAYPVCALLVAHQFNGLIRLNGELKKQPVSLLALLPFVMAYNYGVLVEYNCLFDNSQPENFSATVVNKRISSGKRASYKVKLSPWVDRKTEKEVDIAKGFYNRLEVGDAVIVNVKQGNFSIPWYYLRDARRRD